MPEYSVNDVMEKLNTMDLKLNTLLGPSQKVDPKNLTLAEAADAIRNKTVFTDGSYVKNVNLETFTATLARKGMFGESTWDEPLSA